MSNQCKCEECAIFTSNKSVLLLSFTSAPSGERYVNVKGLIECKNGLDEIALLSNIAKFTKKKERSLWCSLVCEVSGFRSFTRSRVCSYRFCEKFSEYLLPRNYAHRNSLTGKWVIWKYSNKHNISICFEAFPKNTTVGFVMISGI